MGKNHFGSQLTLKRTASQALENLVKKIYGLLTKTEVNMAGYWPSSFFVCVFMDLGSVWVCTHTKRMRPISGHLDRTILVTKGFIIWPSLKFFLQDTAESPKQAR